MTQAPRLGLLVSTLGIAVLLAVGSVANEALANPTVAAANQAYEAGDHAAAIRQYEVLVRGGLRHEILYYNLGNAYFRDGQLGKAIFNYERALRLDPDFDDASHNIGLARSAVNQRVENRIRGADGLVLYEFADGVFETVMLRAAELIGAGTVAILFLVLDVLFFGGLIAVRFLRRGRGALRVCNGLSGVALLLTAVLLAGHLYRAANLRIGIVLPDELELRKGADRDSVERGMVHAGLRVRVIGSESGWLRVRLANGMEGWVEQAGVGQL